ncbi:SDR family oxidoreductase [Dactylosporangium sp. AC04546]|uniref:SDR family NAD(P)-dependent oxidoreductase n=1 Tax=Dactylosporangium sp. AC04546 TaxID=2862460 RepID=UPI001EDEB828|nr:SDR family oxidoreductase [Dactylosporangium sp. AC04546]WVK86837.1 SDR family oxidoreductase [Dactylosporangium sp. AC04546]
MTARPPDPNEVPAYTELLRLDGTTFIVAGGGQGIGRQTCHALAAAGAHVVCVDRDEELARTVAGEVGGTPAVADITTRAGVREVLDLAESLGRPLRGIVDIVGIARFKDLSDLDDEDWTWNLDMNARHAFLFATEGGARLVAGGGGSIVFIASASGMVAADRHAVYGMAKAAVISLVKSASVELGPAGVRVNCVSPGVVWTPRMSEKIGEERRSSYEALSPLGRVAYPSDIASTVLFLSSDLASMISGQNIVVDGAALNRSPFMVGNFTS